MHFSPIVFNVTLFEILEKSSHGILKQLNTVSKVFDLLPFSVLKMFEELRGVSSALSDHLITRLLRLHLLFFITICCSVHIHPT